MTRQARPPTRVWRTVFMRVLVAWLVTSAAAWAQDTPKRPLRIVVPFAPGGNVDITARAIAQGLGDALDQLESWLPSDGVREPLFVANAVKLYRFGG